MKLYSIEEIIVTKIKYLNLIFFLFEIFNNIVVYEQFYFLKMEVNNEQNSFCFQKLI